MGRVERSHDLVRRPVEFWSPAVRRLLDFLAEAGFPAPRVVGIDRDVETLTWLPGDSGADGWSRIVPETGLVHWAQFLRRYHDAVTAYRPSADSVWSSGAGGCAPDQLVCHGDFGPWNGVWDGDRPVGLIDFDHARPATPMFDVAYALEYAAPFRDDDEAVRWLRYPAPPDRRRRIAVFCEAYGIDVPDDLVALVAEQQRLVLATAVDLAARGVEPQASWNSSGHFEVMRARIAWTEGHDL